MSSCSLYSTAATKHDFETGPQMDALTRLHTVNVLIVYNPVRTAPTFLETNYSEFVWDALQLLLLLLLQSTAD